MGLPDIETPLISLISVVVPLYNEAENVRHLCTLAARYLGTVDDIAYEIILVDDGSRDSSWRTISELHEEDNRIKGVRLSRNFGHQAALTAGYDYASGNAVITMDGDLQHPPEMLPAMIEKWREGYDVVSMKREATLQESWFKKTSSAFFYKLINGLSDITIRSAVADFKLLDRRVVKRLNSMRERARFLRGIISWIGFREAELTYTASARFSGSTKYSIRKMMRLAVNAISSFSTLPLTLGFYFGLAVNVVCVILMGYAIYNKVYDDKDLSEWASTFITMLALNGIQLIMIGVIGLYLGRVLEEVKKRPLYIAREELGIAAKRKAKALKRTSSRLLR
ncbi:MAG TPA: glycosyltransferase family 2 protein [Bryobacteraceae bacterium]|nr:glycosyltransferase family 2 protein [Bryobacteraceae bacterium]